MISSSPCRACAWSGKAPDPAGLRRACFIQRTWTWVLLTPAEASREATVLQVVELKLVQSVEASPPCAPSTMTSLGFLLGSASARALNVLVPSDDHSSVVLDMPMESRTILPVFVRLPDVPSGWI